LHCEQGREDKASERKGADALCDAVSLDAELRSLERPERERQSNLSGNIERYNGSNNGFIHYSVREAARDVKIGHATAKRAFDELESHGFIFAEQRGNFHWKIDLTGLRRRPATEWRLTCYDSDRATQFAEKLATKDFMRWQKNHLTVPPQTQDVLVAETHVSTTDTIVNKKGVYGARSGTRKAGFGG
jgi:hypothetical protein